MPISVVCPGCQTRFNVSDKFAGKQGPCPKCKKLLTVPDVPAEDITVHVPEAYAGGGKDGKGRPVLKPIARKQSKFSATAIVAVVGTGLLTLVLAFMMRLAPSSNQMLIAGVGLAVISPVLAFAGYWFLRDDEGEPYQGKALYLRAALCGWAYALLWAAYVPLPMFGLISGEIWQWLFVIPVFVAAGAGIAFATLDLDFGSAALHYCFFLAVTLLLRFAIGMPALWEQAGGTDVIPF